jgi:hypothetical protein
VNADRKAKVPWPLPPDEQRLATIRARVEQQFRKLPAESPITPDGKAAWEIRDLRPSEHTKRLDTIGFRLMPLIALTPTRMPLIWRQSTR